MSIIISKNGSNARVVNPSGFENEDYLQNYIHENPESIPLYEIAEDRKLFIVKREFQTNSGSITCLIFQLMKIVLVVGVPSLYFKIPWPNQAGRKITVFNIWSDGHIQVGYWLKDLLKTHHDTIKTFYKKTNAIDGISGDENQARFFQLPLDKISMEGLKELKQAVIWLKNQF